MPEPTADLPTGRPADVPSEIDPYSLTAGNVGYVDVFDEVDRPAADYILNPSLKVKSQLKFCITCALNAETLTAEQETTLLAALGNNAAMFIETRDNKLAGVVALQTAAYEVISAARDNKGVAEDILNTPIVPRSQEADIAYKLAGVAIRADLFTHELYATYSSRLTIDRPPSTPSKVAQTT